MPSKQDFRPDPSDPVQTFDEASEFSVEPLGVEATPMAEADAELDEAVAEVSVDEAAEDDEETERLSHGNSARTPADEYAAGVDDTGELYGVHTPRAVDPGFAGGPDGGSNADADLGENWLENLEKQAAELGADPEHELDVSDEDDETPFHSTDTRDRPVADKGSGGPGGL